MSIAYRRNNDTKCSICPRNCPINRSIAKGFCGEYSVIRVAKAYLHMWEEPCISGIHGSGTIFFSGCNLKCVYCQNYEISQLDKGTAVSIRDLSLTFKSLEEDGAHNINLVNPTHFADKIIEALSLYRPRIPVIYNSNAYESIETIKKLTGYIDVYLPDLKYFSTTISQKYSGATDYFKVASAAILEMNSQIGSPVFENDIIVRGLIVRHLILPSNLVDTYNVLKWFKENLPSTTYLSLMSQYLPMFNTNNYPEINRSITKKEYEKALGFLDKLSIENGFIQERNSASSDYIPSFDFEGIKNLF